MKLTAEEIIEIIEHRINVNRSLEELYQFNSKNLSQQYRAKTVVLYALLDQINQINKNREERGED